MERKGILQVLEELTDAIHELIRHEKATRDVLRYWMQTLVDKEAPINIDVDLAKLDELKKELNSVKQIALTGRR